MDSKTINKLIRSEVWPVLRQWGFQRFDARMAWREDGELIEVVQFQSFSSQLAGGIGCTTFSFALSIGVFVRGSGQELWVKKDHKSQLLPNVSECHFQRGLRKRSAVDGFLRDDIFFVAEDGSTTSLVLKEAIAVLQSEARSWFQKVGDLEASIEWMERGNSIPLEDLRNRIVSNPGSYAWSESLSTLWLALRRQEPKKATIDRCLQQLEETVGKLFDLPIMFDTAEFREREARALERLLKGLGMEICLPAQDQEERSDDSDNRVVNAKLEIWPALRKLGFSEFTDRLAHRLVGRAVELVVIAPPRNFERKLLKTPLHAFQVSIGVFWPELARNSMTRMNAKGQYRPQFEDCFVNTWLAPRRAGAQGSCFQLASEAVAVLEREGEDWFAHWRTVESRNKLLNEADLEIFRRYPLMRGVGARDSLPRMLLQEIDAVQSRNDLPGVLARARAYLAKYPDANKGFYERWVCEMEKRFAENE